MAVDNKKHEADPASTDTPQPKENCSSPKNKSTAKKTSPSAASQWPPKSPKNNDTTSPERAASKVKSVLSEGERSPRKQQFTEAKSSPKCSLLDHQDGDREDAKSDPKTVHQSGHGGSWADDQQADQNNDGDWESGNNGIWNDDCDSNVKDQGASVKDGESNNAKGKSQEDSTTEGAIANAHTPSDIFPDPTLPWSKTTGFIFRAFILGEISPHIIHGFVYDGRDYSMLTHELYTNAVFAIPDRRPDAFKALLKKDLYGVLTTQVRRKCRAFGREPEFDRYSWHVELLTTRIQWEGLESLERRWKLPAMPVMPTLSVGMTVSELDYTNSTEWENTLRLVHYRGYRDTFILHVKLMGTVEEAADGADEGADEGSGEGSDEEPDEEVEEVGKEVERGADEGEEVDCSSPKKETEESIRQEDTDDS